MPSCARLHPPHHAHPPSPATYPSCLGGWGHAGLLLACELLEVLLVLLWSQLLLKRQLLWSKLLLYRQLLWSKLLLFGSELLLLLLLKRQLL